MKYYRRYIGDYLRDTARLSILEHGAYTLLLDYCYAEERPVPADLEEVYRMVRALAVEERKAVVKVLNLYFTKMDDGWHHKRVDHETRVSQQARKNGRLGGRPLTGLETGLLTGNDTELSAGSETTTNLQPPASSLQATEPPTANRQPGRANALPGWVPADAWVAYCEMRTRIRRPLTERAVQLALGKLADFRSAGQDVRAVLEQSTFNSWQGLFEVKGFKAKSSRDAIERFASRAKS